MKRCLFICNSNVLAADYCDYKYGFCDYDEAIIDRYPLPKEFLEYYKTDPFERCYDDIVDYDKDLAVLVWAWLIAQFAPYSELDESIAYRITVNTIGDIDWDGENGIGENLYAYAMEHHDYFFDLYAKMTGIFPKYSGFIFTALQKKDLRFAKELLNTLINDNRWKLSEKFNVIEGVGLNCQYSETYEEKALFVYFVLPLLENIENKVVQKKIKSWRDEFSEYIDINDDSYRQYCSEETVWRLKYKFEEFDPTKYETESEYLEAKRIKQEAEQKRASELEGFVHEVDTILKEIEKCGDYVEVNADATPDCFDIAFERGIHLYNILCENSCGENIRRKHSAIIHVFVDNKTNRLLSEFNYSPR